MPAAAATPPVVQSEQALYASSRQGPVHAEAQMAGNMLLLDTHTNSWRIPALSIMLLSQFSLCSSEVAFKQHEHVGRVSAEYVGYLFNANNVVFMAARLPQIYSNWHTKNTGQLSLVTNCINTLGCVVSGGRVEILLAEKQPWMHQHPALPLWLALACKPFAGRAAVPYESHALAVDRSD